MSSPDAIQRQNLRLIKLLKRVFVGWNIQMIRLKLKIGLNEIWKNFLFKFLSRLLSCHSEKKRKQAVQFFKIYMVTKILSFLKLLLKFETYEVQATAF
jgi:hypothetical protein